MQGLIFDLSLPKMALVRATRGSQRMVSRQLKLQEIPAPKLPNDGWVRLHVVACGICGTDLGALKGTSSPRLAPFNSFPAVMGHEILGEVIEVGIGVTRVHPGDRVVVDPFLPCLVRDLPPCPACQRGEPWLCQNWAEGAFSPAMLLGFCRDLPGGFAEEIVAHESQLFVVPETLGEEAVLTEPLSIGMHAVLRHLPMPGERVLVIGAGSVGLLTLAALQLAKAQGEISVVARYPFQAQAADRLGAVHLYESAQQAAQEAGGARTYTGALHSHFSVGGFDTVFDCVGSESSFQEALEATREGGKLILVGTLGMLTNSDLTRVWSREITIAGSVGYGPEPGFASHTHEIVLDRLSHNTAMIEQLRTLITHRYALPQYPHALRAMQERRASGAIKVVLTPP